MQVCRVCGVHAVKKCAQCKTAVYCSRDCQKFDWSKLGHSKVCVFVLCVYKNQRPSTAPRAWGHRVDVLSPVDLLWCVSLGMFGG
jgi:hypothetical protein